MKNTIFRYLFINAAIVSLVFYFFYFSHWDIYYREYGFISSLIISLSSIGVFLGVFLSIKLGINREFLVYLYCTVLKNGILIIFCVKHKETVAAIIFYLFFIYVLLMAIEIIFILQLIQKNNAEKTKKV
ncbi:MAG: hypothetical protein LBP34_02945 [Flavobacteriaceae bacterium]|jgi:hypothetical protein|nr:hypothetical protein [Flavobacteriaceae bacterium]